MGSMHRLGMPLIVGVVGLGVACGGSDGGNGVVTPQALTVAAGDGQIGPPGGSLPGPLRVTLMGSDNQPFLGATVNWTVTLGSANLVPTSSSTDSAGHASTTVFLGNTLGPVTVQAAVTGVAPVTFNATAVDPCATSVAFSLPGTANGTLSNADCSLGGFFTDLYSLSLAAPQTSFTLTETAPTFDSWLELYRANGKFVAFNDDIELGVDQNSRIYAILATGSFLVAPSSYSSGVTGAYTVQSALWNIAIKGCIPVWVSLGVTFSDSVSAGDCVDTSGPTDFYSDQIGIVLDSGTVIRVAERSANFNTYLTIFDAGGGHSKFNDDSSGTTTNSYLVDTVPRTSVYVLDISTSTAGDTGAYTLEIAATTTLASLQSQSAGTRMPIRFMPLRGDKSRPWMQARPRRNSTKH